MRRCPNVYVYRGQPSSEHDPKPYARNQAQKARWERDQRVTVQLRPLKYRYERDSSGQPLIDADGKRVVKGKDEKGVDVLCALAVLREARKPDVDLVILASHDSDLEPAIERRSPSTQQRSRLSAGSTPPSRTALASFGQAAAACGTPGWARLSFATAGISPTTRSRSADPHAQDLCSGGCPALTVIP